MVDIIHSGRQASYFFLLFGFSATFSYFEEKFLLFPTFEIFRNIYLLIYVFLGLGGISGYSMVPMLHTAVLPLGVNWGWTPLLAAKLSGTMGSPSRGWGWDRHPLVTRAPPSWPVPILGLEDVFEWDPSDCKDVKLCRNPVHFFSNKSM